MKIFEYIDRINLLHKLIKERKTGTPEKLAIRLSISTSRLYVILDELKLMGAPIEYSRQLQTYFYLQPFEVNIKVDFILLNEKEVLEINAGFFYSTKLPTTFFVE